MRRARREDLKRADQLAPGDQWMEGTRRTQMTMIERRPSPLSNVVRLKVRRADGVEQVIDLFATDKRVVLRPS